MWPPQLARDQALSVRGKEGGPRVFLEPSESYRDTEPRGGPNPRNWEGGFLSAVLGTSQVTQGEVTPVMGGTNEG